MAIELRLILGALGALLLAVLFTPLAIRAAGRLQFFDQPVGYKEHGAPTPYLGGAAVVAAILIPFMVLGAPLDGGATAVLALAALLLWAIGTVDDRRTVTPTARVVVEIAMGVALWAAGLGWDLGAGPIDAVATVAWLVLVINAVNLFDNLDGAASSIGASVAAGAAALAVVVTGDAWVAVLAAATGGSLLGFLRFNLAAPARIFLGDGGSMPVGMFVAVAVMAGASGAADGLTAPAAAIVLAGIPLLDTALVIVSRRRRGVSLLTGGRDHLSHRTLARVGRPSRVAVVLATVQIALSALVIAASQVSSSAIWATLVLYVIAASGVIAWLERVTPPDTRAGVTEPTATRPARTAPPRPAPDPQQSPSAP